MYEGDTLYSELHVESACPVDNGGALGLRSLVYAVSDSGPTGRCWIGDLPRCSSKSRLDRAVAIPGAVSPCSPGVGVPLRLLAPEKNNGAWTRPRLTGLAAAWPI
ncbi:hypothetical protein I553_2757 [Mycobacterium xenopi 4042]|uniref:Uncharacterized protein n=1 Tax=Mycobacterium xenopi 4042 TaxID=1299334 RepID=X8AK05_MYCXE|nr:hypothetical protein I553_2757 [Mycobacterium xenopi 4042]